MSTLLAFHKSILDKIHDPFSSEFILLARGLGLRRVVCKLLQIYDSPQNLVMLVNASSEEEAAIGEELGVLGCRNPGLRIVGFETNKKERYVDSSILLEGVADGLQAGLVQAGRTRLYHFPDINCRYAHVRYPHASYYWYHHATLGAVRLSPAIYLHAIKRVGHRVSPSSSEAFIARLYREKNKNGFLKAFSDQPEHITSGLSPLRTILKELRLRTVHIYPRYFLFFCMYTCMLSVWQLSPGNIRLLRP